METGVSIIICCYNSAERIEKVLEHIQNQKNASGFPWEVIVVDNASRDNTAEIAKNFWNNEEIGFKVVYEENPGLSNARIKGINTSIYPILIFVDDDNWISKEYVYRAYQIMKDHPDVGLAGGLGMPLSNSELPSWFKNYQDAYAVGKQYENEGYIKGGRTYLHGAGIVMRKEGWKILEDAGFRFSLSGRKEKALSSGEDSEISSAFRLAGYDLYYEPKLLFKHIIPQQRLKWEYLMKLAREFGKSYVILDIYKSEIKNYNGWKKIKTRNWFLKFTSTSWQLIKLLPRFTIIRLKGQKGNREEFMTLYYHGMLNQLFAIKNKYKKRNMEINMLSKKLKDLR